MRGRLVGIEPHVREQVERAVEQHAELGAGEVDAETPVDAEAEAEVAVGTLAEDVEVLGVAPPLRGVVVGGADVHRHGTPFGNFDSADTGGGLGDALHRRERLLDAQRLLDRERHQLRSSRTAASCSGCESSMNIMFP